jgi:hypothetical protein
MSEPYLDQNQFSAIAYNAVGRASEVNNLNAYQLQHSTGNSGWSVGFMQWDFGQGPVRQAQVDVLLQRYQSHAAPGERFSATQLASLEHRLKTPGQTGNALTSVEQGRLNGFLRSDPGRAFVAELDGSQMQRKWDNVGEPLSRMDWLQKLGQEHPDEANKIVAMTAKLFNQNETRGGRLLDHLRDHPMSAEQTRDWIRSTGVAGLNAAAQSAIRSGCDNALQGAELLSRIEGSGTLAGSAWNAEVVQRGNPSLSRDFSTNPNAQLLDKMFRDPGNGDVLLDKMERGTASPFRIAGTGESYAVTLGTDGSVTTALNGHGYRVAPDGSRTVVGGAQPQQEALRRMAMAQLAPGLLASGRSAQEVDMLVGACVIQCEGRGDPQKFLLSKDGARVAMVYPDQPVHEVSVDAALAQGRSQAAPSSVQPAAVTSTEPQVERVR